MNLKPSSLQTRRKILKLLGGSVVFVPLASLQGCSGEKEPATVPATDKAAPAVKPKPAAPTKTESMPMEAPAAADGALPKLAEDSAQALALGYLHDASKVDRTKYARYATGQICGNCALFQEKAGEEWGGCSLFPRNSVNTNGWCSAYVPVPVK